MQQKPMIILTGPTAVGKSALSVELAKKINGAVISADSMPVLPRSHRRRCRVLRII